MPTAVSQELSEFLLEFGIALNRHAIYPDGHPSLSGSARAVVTRLVPLLRERSAVSIGVARRQLVIEGVATDAAHPVLRSVAERLHRQHIGAVTLGRGTTELELQSLLTLVAVEAESLEIPLGLGDPQRLREWPHVRLYPMTYDQLELIDGGDGDGGSPREDSGASQLWLGLARAAVAQEDASIDVAAMDAETVAQAINEHPAAPAYDQVIVGYLLQLATQLRDTRTPATQPVRRRLSNLITRLEPGTLQRLIEMGGDFSQRRQFVLNTTDALATDSVLDVLKAAANTSRQTISSSMLRMLTKLSANSGSGSRGELADSAMREQVRDLIEGWTLDDPNPDAYTQALESMARATSNIGDGDDGAYPPEADRMVRMALEVDVTGVPFWRAVQTMLEEQRIGELLDILEDVPDGVEAARLLWGRLEASDQLRRLLTTDPIDFPTLDRIMHRLPEDAYISLLLDRISESSSRTTRMAVFQRLALRGERVAPRVVERLYDERWFVQRNMLALLNEIGRVPDGFSPLKHASHPRPTVRREALQLAMRDPVERERAICIAFTDSDERTARVGVRAAQDGVPAAAVPLALRCLDNADFSSELRVQVIRLLAPVRTPAVFDAMLRHVVTGRTLLGKPRLAPPSPEAVAALTALVKTWGDDARVQPVLERVRAAGVAEYDQVLRTVQQ